MQMNIFWNTTWIFLPYALSKRNTAIINKQRNKIRLTVNILILLCVK